MLACYRPIGKKKKTWGLTEWVAQRGDRPVALAAAAVTSRSFFQQWNICSTNAISMQELSVQFTQGSVQSPTNKVLRWALFLKHCGKKIRDELVISRTLHRSGLLFVPNFEFLVGQREIFKKWTRQHPPIGIEIFGICCLFHLLNIFLPNKSS